ncbi:MAG TPA: CPBP family glutamic-type intramembrane protease [Candidatus Baltobacteraceae bacterium]|nr:CPBP family glutamic-type intramembrane protease [Candidatus Baltobacteraceae bacterium]
METDLRILIVVAFTGLLVVLRLDAARFGAAEYDDDAAGGGWRAGLRRLAWYAVGLAIAAGIFVAHPTPGATLGLAIGTPRLAAIGLGLLFGGAGAGVAAAFAWLRYGRLRLPSARTYPGAIANSLGTALIDEVAFRGAFMGLLLAAGLPIVSAVAIQGLVYGLATRLGAPGRSHAMLLMSLALGVAAGATVIATGGIGAAVIGHAIARFAIFVCTGHAGQVRPPGEEPEEVAEDHLPPEGWQVADEPPVAGMQRS